MPGNENLEDKTGIIDRIVSQQDQEEYRKLSWKGTFDDYLQLIKEKPEITRTAHQRLYDMVISYGVREYEDAKKRIIHYTFFDDLEGGGKDAIYGLDIPLMKLVDVFKASAKGHDTRKRLLLLHGPVGSSKSTIARLLKKGLERYSLKDGGAIYTLEWDVSGLGIVKGEEIVACPMNEEPLHLIPEERRAEAAERLSSEHHAVQIEKGLCPVCSFMHDKLAEKYEGRWGDIIRHVKIKRFTLSEKKRRGIGTFQPKDEKNQDSTELSGDINYRKIAEYGSDSDPRAFNFDGEFNIANRGLIEFIEVLKLDVAFLYDLLGATQEHSIKPKKFSQTDIDEVIIAHTNEAELKKLQANDFMEALKDRTIRIDIPYITKWTEEVKIYDRDYGKVKGRHIAPHTREMAALWAVLTRLEEPKKHKLSILQKAKLYAGKTITDFTEDNIKELRKEAQREGFEGISPRFIQDKISNALVTEKAETCLSPFLLLNELEAGLKHHSLVKKEEDRRRYEELVKVVKEEYEDIVKQEVQLAISADEKALANLCANYIDNIKAFTQKEKVKNKYTGQEEGADERLMRAVEEKMEIADSRKDTFRTEIMNHIGALAVEGKTFDFKTNERLRKALELKLFEDQKDTIKLTSLVSNVVDKETQEKIDIVKKRLIDNHGYCNVCATDVLSFVASIFARGDPKKE